MAEGPPVLHDLSACCYDRRCDGEPTRLRAMRVLVAREDPERGTGIGRVANCPQSFAGCLAAARYGL